MRYNMNIIEEDLENGMHVILVEKPEYRKSLFMLASPCGGFDISQKIDGQIVVHPSGCAHFLEHQMFRLDGKDVTNLFAKFQSQSNAFTSYTETAYYFQTTSNVKKPLALLMDFVQNLDIDEKSIEKEKGIILSEYHMYEQNPEQKLLTNTWKALYHNHPFKIDILGTKKDIEDMSVEALHSFYDYNYDPSRMVLVGVTGQDTQEIMEYIKVYQKNVPSKYNQNIERFVKEEPQHVVLESVSETMDITIPYICVAYKLDSCKDVKSALLMDMALQMRLDSLFSSLNPDYQKWIDDRIISQIAFAECDFNVDHGYLIFVSQTNKGDEFIELVNHLVQEIPKQMDEETFEAIQIRMIAQNIRSLDNFDGLAIDLMRAYFEKYSYFESMKLVETMSVESIKESCSSLDFSNKSIVKIMPKVSNLDKMD